MKHTLVIATVLAALGASAAVEVTGVTAKQRWPWNNLVDIDFTLTGEVGEKYVVNVDSQCAGGAKRFSAMTFVTDPVVSPGVNRITWDFGRDYPGIRAEDMSFAVSVTPKSGSAQPLYLCIDLSGGSAAASYPVRYSLAAPVHVCGATGEPCQTTELWLRRIAAPNSVQLYGFYNESSDEAYYARQTKDYYIGVFEVTQKQYERVMGVWPSFFTNAAYRASRPVEQVACVTVAGVRRNVQLNPGQITSGSFLGKLRAKTGLAITLPTVAQWEWACRGGKSNKDNFWWYLLADGTYPEASQIMRTSANSSTSTATADCDLNSGTAAVGTYLPNAFGLYDMLGNVMEYTCEVASAWGKRMVDALAEYRKTDPTLGTSANPLVDPQGVNPELQSWCPMMEATAWTSSATSMWYFLGDTSPSWAPLRKDEGFRISLTVE